MLAVSASIAHTLLQMLAINGTCVRRARVCLLAFDVDDVSSWFWDLGNIYNNAYRREKRTQREETSRVGALYK